MSGVSPVSRGRSPTPGWVRAASIVGCSAAAVGAVCYLAWPKHHEERLAPAQPFSMGQPMPAPIFVRAEVPAPPPKLPMAAVEPPIPAPAPAAVMTPTASFAIWSDDQALNTQIQTRQARAQADQVLQQERLAKLVADRSGGDGKSGSSPYAQMMQATKFGDVRPEPRRFNPMYTLRKGTVIPCTPAQPISGDMPGPVRCTIGPDPIMSMDGTTVLLPSGTQINGTIERGVTNGQDRLAVIFTDMLTPGPDFLPIPLDSPAADELGQSGVPVDVNTHFARRLGAAAAFSLLDIATGAVTSAASSGRGGTTLNFGAAGTAAQNLGQSEFQRDANVPASSFRAQAQPIAVYLNHYIDLSLIYQNRVLR